MGACLITLLKTYNVDVIKSVVLNDVIWDAVSEDGHEKSGFIPNFSTGTYYEILDGPTLLGLFVTEHINSVTQRVHPMVLPEYRNRSKEICREIIQMWCSSTDYSKLIAEIPECYKGVIKFAMQMGLKPEGIRTASYMKKGDIIDVYLFGATIEELKNG